MKLIKFGTEMGGADGRPVLIGAFKDPEGSHKVIKDAAGLHHFTRDDKNQVCRHAIMKGGVEGIGYEVLMGPAPTIPALSQISGMLPPALKNTKIVVRSAK